MSVAQPFATGATDSQHQATPHQEGGGLVNIARDFLGTWGVSQPTLSYS